MAIEGSVELQGLVNISHQEVAEDTELDSKGAGSSQSGNKVREETVFGGG